MAEGWNAVVWSAETDSFPFLKGMSSIVSGIILYAEGWRCGCLLTARSERQPDGGLHADC